VLLLQEQLMRQDFARFSTLKLHLLETVDMMLANDIARLMAMIPQEVSTSDSFVKGKDHV
jgi:EH domain-containing protein 1